MVSQPNLQTQISEKRRILRSNYGGMMSLKDLASEIGSTTSNARRWGYEIGAAVRVGSGRPKYDVDVVAKHIVILRGMC